MPSPVGHMLGGLAAGSLLGRQRSWRVLAAFAVAGALPDVDFLLPIQHRGPSHGIGAAVLMFGAALVVLSLAPGRIARVRLAAAIALAYLSHVLLDWLGQDTWEPHGLMALWPFSSRYYISGLNVFDAVTRRYWLDDFWRRNLAAVAREIVILLPAAALAWWLAGRGSRADPGGSSTSA